MKSKSLAEDYLSRSEKRLKAIDTLFQEEAWADVVRESQEVVELSLKGLLRSWNIEVPRVHDVGSIIQENMTKASKKFHKDLKRFCEISHDLRRDRELAFYGSEDLTPSEFYKKEHAEDARQSANFVVTKIREIWN